jgi:transposase
MYRVRLTEAQQQELKHRTRAAGLKPRTRDRLEMVRLAHAGWSIPKIARHLQISEVRVRHWVKRFLTDGFDALPDAPHLGRQPSLGPAVLAALRQELEKEDRTWTAPQLAEWVAEQHGLRLTPDWLGRLLKQANLSYKRTYRSLKHKQDPVQVEEKRAELEAAEKGEMPGVRMSAI